MRSTYLFLLRFCPDQIRAEFGEEMLQVFDEAARQSCATGRMAYLQFCAREVLGLLANIIRMEGSMKYKGVILQGGLAGLLLAAAIAAGLNTRPYTSTAVLRVVPKQIPDQFVSAQGLASPDSAVQDVVALVTSRGRLTKLILDNDLYASERARVPMQDVVKKMRKAIHIQVAPAITVWFAFSDPEKAQKVTAEIVSMIISEHARLRTARAVIAAQFMQDSVNAAAANWEQKLATVRATQAAGKFVERIQLDASIARQRYEILSGKAADAEMLSQLERRQQGPTLEVLDPASLPSSDARPSVVMSAIAGFVIGALLAYLVRMLFAVWRPRPALQSA